MKRSAAGDNGFTIIELMITLAIFGIVLTGVYSVYKAQLQSHYTQQEIMEMQQNTRAALYLMEREIKMAGLNPTGADDIGITVADAHTMSFNMDFTGGFNDGDDDDGDGISDEGANGIDDNGNGLVDEADEAEWCDGDVDDPNEQVVYALSNDADGNGMNDGLPTENNDGGACDLWRNGELLAVNIDALNFVYLDAGGAPLATPVADTTQIRSVQVSVVARSGSDPSAFSINYADTQSYQNQQGDTVLWQQDDTFRRLLMATEVKCRNLGL
jgi:type IV pilus assembly protein PilW